MEEQPEYLAYLLRLWRANTEQDPVWRASLDSPHTGERRGFTDLAALFAFLQDKTAGQDLDTGSAREEGEERKDV